MEWFGFEGTFKIMEFHRDTFNYPRLLQAPVNFALETSRDGENEGMVFFFSSQDMRIKSGVHPWFG